MKKDRKYLLTIGIFTLVIILDSVYILMNNFNVSKFAMIGFIAIYVAYIIFILWSIRSRLKEEMLATQDDEDEDES